MAIATRRFVGTLTLAVGPLILAAEANPSFDHATDVHSRQRIAVEPGSEITVEITDTCPEFFDYTYIGFLEKTAVTGRQEIVAVEPPCNSESVAKGYLQSAGFCEASSKMVTFIYAKKFAGYQVNVSRKKNAPPTVRALKPGERSTIASKLVDSKKSCGKKFEELYPNGKELLGTVLPDAWYILEIQRSPWALGMSGGLTISDVTDPRFAVINDPNSTATPPGTIVARDRDAEDSQALGFAGFLHVYNRHWTPGDVPIAATFGLGISDKNSISGFLGVSAAAWELAYLTIGWNWRSVDRLPTGQQLGSPAIGANVLSDLPTRVDGGWFIAVSFKLMSPSDAFFTERIAMPSAESKGNVEPE